MTKAIVKEIHAEYQALRDAGASHDEAMLQIEISFELHHEDALRALGFVS